MDSPDEMDFDTAATRTAEVMVSTLPSEGGGGRSTNTTQMMTYAAQSSEGTQRTTRAISPSDTIQNEEGETVDTIPTVPKSRPTIPNVTPNEERGDIQVFGPQWMSPEMGISVTKVCPPLLLI